MPIQRIQAIEPGYRGAFFNRLMVDACYYFNIYDDFISTVRVRQAQDINGNPTDPFSDPTMAAIFGLNLGFNVAWKWQDAFTWNSSFAMNGHVPAINTIDARVSYTFTKLKTILKIGGSNLLNYRYSTFYGGPSIGAIYYISLTFNELMN